MKYALTPGLTLHRRPSTPTSARSKPIRRSSTCRRSRRSSPSAGRSSSKDPATSTSTSTATTARAPACSIRGASAASPQGTDDLPSGDDIYTDAPLQSTILGAAKLTGRVGKFSIGVMQAVTQEELATIADRRRRGRSSRSSRSTSYSVGRVRREFANQSSIGVMLTATQAQLGDSLAIPAGQRLHRRRRLRLALQDALQPHRLLGRAAASTATPRRSTRIQENSRHYFQRPDADSRRRSIPTRTSLTGSAAAIGISKIGGERVRFNSNVVVQVAGLRHQRRRLPAPRRPAHASATGCRSAATSRRAGSAAGTSTSTSTPRWNYDGDRLVSGGNVNAHATFINNWRSAAASTSTALDFDDRADARRPGRAASRASTTSGPRSTPTTASAVSLNYFIGMRRRRRSARGSRDQPSVATFRPMPALTVIAGVRVQPHGHRLAVGGQRHRHARPLRVRPPRSDDGRADRRLNYTMTPNLSLQLYAEPFVSAGDYSAFKELVDGRSLDYGERYAPFAYDSPRRRSRLQREVVPDDQRAALGIQAGLDAVRRLAAGARERRGARRLPLRPRHARHLRRRAAATCSS